MNTIETALQDFEQAALLKLRTFADNHLNSAISEVPQFTDQEINYLENDLEAGTLGVKLPDEVIALFKMGNVVIEKASDPVVISWLNALKAKIDTLVGPNSPGGVAASIAVAVKASNPVIVANATAPPTQTATLAAGIRQAQPVPAPAPTPAQRDAAVAAQEQAAKEAAETQAIAAANAAKYQANLEAQAAEKT